MNPAIKAKCKSCRKRQEFCLDMDIPSCFASFIEDPTEEHNCTITLKPMEKQALLQLCMTILNNKKQIKKSWHRMLTP